MKFPNLREFRPRAESLQSKIEEMIHYISVDLMRTLKDTTVGLTKLSFQDNFEGFIVEGVSIPGTTEVAIRNELDIVPSQRIILRGGDGSQNVTDGDTEWDSNFVYLENRGGTDTTVTVLFLK